MRMKKGQEDKESRRSVRRPKARQILEKFAKWRFLFLISGAELAKRQSCSRRTTKKNGGSNENGTRSADQRKQMDGGSTKKGGSSQKTRTELT